MKPEKFVPYNEQMSQLGKNSWSVARLIHLSKDFIVMTVPLVHLNIYHKYEEMTLRQLVGHIQAVNEADLNCPIILDEDGEIMDGRHRIMKAILMGQESIKAVRFEKNPVPCEHIE